MNRAYDDDDDDHDDDDSSLNVTSRQVYLHIEKIVLCMQRTFFIVNLYDGISCSIFML